MQTVPRTISVSRHPVLILPLIRLSQTEIIIEDNKNSDFKINDGIFSLFKIIIEVYRPREDEVPDRCGLRDSRKVGYIGAWRRP